MAALATVAPGINLQLKCAEAFAAAQTRLCLTNLSVSQPANQPVIHLVSIAMLGHTLGNAQRLEHERT